MLLGAITDACVLFPPALRDTLLGTAAAGLYRVGWSDEILEELRRAILRRARGADAVRVEEKVDRLIAELRRAFPEALVGGYEEFIDRIAIDDPDDRHVVAAAITGGAV